MGRRPTVMGITRRRGTQDTRGMYVADAAGRCASALAAAETACQFAVHVRDDKTLPKAPIAYGLRDGEIAAELPARSDASLYYIGRIRTPWKRREDCPKNARGSDAVCTVELDPRWAAGLQGLETVTHVLLLYWMDQARRDLVLQSPRHYAEHRGTFRAALAGAAQSDRGFGGAARPHRRQHAFGRRHRLPRRHAAPRHQAVFRLDGFRAGRASSAGTRSGARFR